MEFEVVSEPAILQVTFRPSNKNIALKGDEHVSHHFRNDIVVRHLLVGRIFVFKKALQQGNSVWRSSRPFLGSRLVHAGADKLDGSMNERWMRQLTKR